MALRCNDIHTRNAIQTQGDFSLDTNDREGNEIQSSPITKFSSKF